MTIQYYLQVPGLHGGSTDMGYVGAFDVTGFSYNVDATAAYTRSDVSIGPLDFGALQVNFSDLTGLGAFLTYLTSGQSLSGASLVETVSLSGHSSEIYRVNLSQVHVDHVTQGADGGYSVSLDYGAVGVITHTILPTGLPGPADQFGYSQVTNSVIAPPANVGGTGPAAPPVQPTTYYLLIDGVNGGSTDPGHVGWFELTDFNLAAFDAVSAAAGGGASPGKASFDPLDLQLTGSAGVTALLTDLAQSHLIAGARIEGVSSQGGASTVVYDLNLTQVGITQLNQNSGGQYDLQLAFGAFQLSTSGLPTNGAVPVTQTVAWNVLTNSSDVSLRDIAPGSGGSGSPQANDFYLEVTGLHGPSVAAGVQGAFEVLGFDFDVGGASGHPEFGELSITFNDKAGLTSFMSSMVLDKDFSDASLIGTDLVSGKAVETYRVNLADLQVTSVEENSGGGYTATFDYRQIGVITHQLQANGTPGPAQSFGYDTATNSVIAPPTGAVATTAAPASHPSIFYLLVDGVNGGSTDPGHVGWFKLTSYDLSALSHADIGPLGTAVDSTTTEFQPLSVTFDGSAGLTDLLNIVAKSQLIDGARIEGVVDATHPTVVYSLDLAHVAITSLGQAGADNYSLGLDFSAFKLSTSGLNNDGSATAPQVISWDLASQSTGVTLPSISPDLFVGGSAPASQFFLEMPGVDGASQAQGFRGALDVSGFEFGITGAPAGASGASASDLHVSFSDETGLATFLSYLTTARDVAGASLVGTASIGGQLEETYRINLADVVVTDVNESSSGYGVDLSYGTLGVTTHPLEQDGTLGPAQVFGYDRQLQATAPPPPNVSPGAAGPAVQADTYYLLVDGINGGGSNQGHEGWFQLNDFNFDASALADLTSGAPGAARPQFGSVSLQVAPSDGLPDILAQIASGRAIDGIRIEGVDESGHPTAVYDLNLVNVTVTSITQDQSGDYQLVVDYSAVQLATTGIGANGQPGPTKTMSWDLATDTAKVTLPDISPGAGTAPATPSAPLGLGLDPSGDTGVAGDQITTASHLTVDGQAAAGATVTLYDGTTAVGSATANSAGAFQITTSTLSDGVHTLTAKAVDSTGAVSAASASYTVTVDTTAPGAPAGLALDASTDTGAAGDGVTSASLLVIDGQAEAGAQVTLRDGQAVIGTGAADSSGAFHIATTALGDGVHAITATATDAAGNTGPASTPFSVTVDSLALSPDVGVHTANEQAEATGSAATDSASATLAFSDADLAAQHIATAGAPSISWSGGASLPDGLAATLAAAVSASVSDSTGTGAGSVTATFAAPDATFDFLAQGETLTVTYAVTLAGGGGTAATQPVTFTVTGADDAPTIDAIGTSGALSEQANVTGNAAADQTSGILGFHDADLDDRPSATLTGQAVTAHTASGATFALSAAQVSALEAGFQAAAPAGGTVAWSYGIADHALDFLGAGESVTLVSSVLVDDHHGGTASQAITVTLNGADDAPVAVADLASVQKGGTITADRAHGVLANDSDPDQHDVLQVGAVNGAAANVGHAVTGSYGSLTLNADGSYNYAAASKASLPSSGVGQDVFTYAAADPHGGTTTQSLTVLVYDNGASYVVGMPGVTLVAGGNGKGVVDAGVGDHLLLGGNGKDVLIAGLGSDTMTGGSGADTFVFGHLGFGSSVITDFATSNDQVQFDHRLLASFADVMSHAAQVGHDVVITVDAADKLTLQNVNLGSLHASDFLFT